LLIFGRLESYAKGVNDFVDSMDWWPLEFYMMWTGGHGQGGFEPWTPEDTLCVQVMVQYFISFDWFLELTRQRLTEIYDKELVDKMLPFR
jgi:acyl-homoserine lactone acylase PvdQ